MSFLAGFTSVALLQLAAIVACFFLPELLFRLGGQERRWHVPLASALLIAAVLSLTALHGRARNAAPPPQQAAAQAPRASDTVDAPQSDYDISLRFGTLPVLAGTAGPLELSIVNNGADALFACELDLLAGDGLTAAPAGAFELEPQTASVQIPAGGTGSCAWRIKARQPGTYVLQPSAASNGRTASQQLRVMVQQPQQAAPRPDAPRAEVLEQVWVYSSLSAENAAGLAAHLHEAGFRNAQAKGEWKTRSEEQYLFYRDAAKTNLDALFVEIGVTELQPFHYDSERVGAKVKEMFRDNPNLGFLVIVR